MCTERIINTDLRIVFSELQERVNKLTQEICTERNKLDTKCLKNKLETESLRNKLEVLEVESLKNKLETESLRNKLEMLEAESLRNKLKLVETESLIPNEEGDEIRVSQGGIKAREWEIVRKKIDKKFSSNGDLPDLISF